MKQARTAAFFITCMLLLSSTALARGEAEQTGAGNEKGEQVLKAQTLCPVTGKEIDSAVFLDMQGQRIYFCCPGCIDIFKKDPDKYFEAAGEAGVLFENVQTSCPVMGGSIDERFYADYKGRRVYFCCEGCIKTFHEDPVKYLHKLDEQTGTSPGEDEAPPEKREDHGHE